METLPGAGAEPCPAPRQGSSGRQPKRALLRSGPCRRSPYWCDCTCLAPRNCLLSAAQPSSPPVQLPAVPARQAAGSSHTHQSPSPRQPPPRSGWQRGRQQRRGGTWQPGAPGLQRGQSRRRQRSAQAGERVASISRAEGVRGSCAAWHGQHTAHPPCTLCAQLSCPVAPLARSTPLLACACSLTFSLMNLRKSSMLRPPL